jgi:O-methyltransferase involved in polyketide biosynthesis
MGCAVNSQALPLLSRNLSLTAALVNESRARRIAMSQDKYAREWIPVEMRKPLADLWDTFSKEVYRFDDIALSIRNRFFLQLMNDAASCGSTIVVAPCGLTSYPFLVQSATQFIEIDLPPVIRYKNKRNEWLDTQVTLPRRDVCRFEMDLRSPKRFANLISRRRRDSNLLVLLEGISYYLSSDQWHSLLKSTLGILQPGDIFSFDYWAESDRNLSAYANYEKFCFKYVGAFTHGFNFLASCDIGMLSQQCEVACTSAVEEECRILGSSVLASHKNEIVIDRYCVAKRM